MWNQYKKIIKRCPGNWEIQSDKAWEATERAGYDQARMGSVCSWVSKVLLQLHIDGCPGKSWAALGMPIHDPKKSWGWGWRQYGWGWYSFSGKHKVISCQEELPPVCPGEFPSNWARQGGTCELVCCQSLRDWPTMQFLPNGNMPVQEAVQGVLGGQDAFSHASPKNWGPGDEEKCDDHRGWKGGALPDTAGLPYWSPGDLQTEQEIACWRLTGKARSKPKASPKQGKASGVGVVPCWGTPAHTCHTFYTVRLKFSRED